MQYRTINSILVHKKLYQYRGEFSQLSLQEKAIHDYRIRKSPWGNFLLFNKILYFGLN